MENIINNEVINAVIAGDDDAFRLLYKTYYKRVYFFVYQYCYNQSLAEDIVQNTFVEIYRSIGSLKNNEAFYSWMLRIAYRQMQKSISKEVRINANRIDIEGFENIFENNEPLIDEQIRREEIVEIIEQIINTLSVEYRETLLLYFLYDLSIKETASILSVSEGTVKSRIHRGRKSLKKELEKLGGMHLLHNIGLFIGIGPPIIASGIEKYLETSAHYGIHSLLRSPITFGAVAGVSALSIAVISTNFAVPTPTYQAQLVADIEITKPCQIVEVAYDASPASAEIVMDVVTTSTDYEKITINGVAGNIIYENGVYEVGIFKEGKILDERVVEITNIDKNNPTARVENQGYEYTLYLSDQGSGINTESITYYKNEMASQEFSYDKEQNVIYFTYDEGSTNDFYVEDLAKNWVRIEINSPNY